MYCSERTSFRVAGAVFVAWAALLALWLIPQYVAVPRSIESIVLSPRFWPYAVATFMAVVALFALAQGLRPQSASETASQAASESTTEATTQTTTWADSRATGGQLPRLLAVALLMVVYAVSIEPVGVVVSSAAFVLVVSAICLRRVSPGVMAWVAVLPFALSWFFGKFVGVRFPVWPDLGG